MAHTKRWTRRDGLDSPTILAAEVRGIEQGPLHSTSTIYLVDGERLSPLGVVSRNDVREATSSGKFPGVRPVGVGETWWRLFGKVVLQVAGPEAKYEASIDQLCSGLEGGIEGGTCYASPMGGECAGGGGGF